MSGAKKFIATTDSLNNQIKNIDAGACRSGVFRLCTVEQRNAAGLDDTETS